MRIPCAHFICGIILTTAILSVTNRAMAETPPPPPSTPPATAPEAQKCPVCGQIHLTGQQIQDKATSDVVWQISAELTEFKKIAGNRSDAEKYEWEKEGPRNFTASISDLPEKVLSASEAIEFRKAINERDRVKLESIAQKLIKFKGSKILADHEGRVLQNRLENHLRAYYWHDMHQVRERIEQALQQGKIPLSSDLESLRQSAEHSVTPGGLSLIGKIQAAVETHEKFTKSMATLNPGHTPPQPPPMPIPGTTPGTIAGTTPGTIAPSGNPSGVLPGGFVGPFIPLAVPQWQGIPVSPGIVTPSLPPEAESSRNSFNSTILVINPAKNGSQVGFAFAGTAYDLPPGGVQELTGEKGIITFDRGGSFGEGRYALSDGSFEFVVSPEKGWDLKSKKFTVKLDNSASTQDFSFLSNGKTITIKAGQTHEMTGRHPILVVFDRGDGGQPISKMLDDGTYKIGVDGTTHLLDIYRVDETISSTRPPANSLGSPQAAAPAPPAGP